MYAIRSYYGAVVQGGEAVIELGDCEQAGFDRHNIVGLEMAKTELAAGGPV